MNTDELGILGELAEALGLTNDGSFQDDWLSDPGKHLSAMLANKRQREALVAFVDEVLGGPEREASADGLTWLPIAQTGAPQVTVFVVLDDKADEYVAIGVGVKVASSAPQAALAVHVPVFRAAKEGHGGGSPVLLGTPAARAYVSLDITTATAPAVPGQAHLGGVALSLSVPTGAGGAAPQFSLRLRGLQMPGAPTPRDLTLAVSDLETLESSVLELVLGLARAQAAALPSGPLAALAGLVGLRDGVALPPLPLQDLARDGVVALARWLGDNLLQPSTRALWLGQLKLLLGGLPDPLLDADTIGFPIGPLRLTVAVPATPGAAGLVRIQPTVGIEWRAQAGVWLRAEAVLCSLDLGNGAARALPSLNLGLVLGLAAGGTSLVNVAAPTALRVDTLRAGFGLDAQRRPSLLLAAEGVDIAGHPHGTLDLSSPDAIAQVGATVFSDVADAVFDRLGPAADAVRVLLGLSAPAGHPEVSPVAIGAFLQDPLAAIRGHWLGLLHTHAAAVPAVLTQLRNLVADRAGNAIDISGLGRADAPWQLALAGPVVLQAWTVGDRLLFGPAVRFTVGDIGQGCTRLETSIAITLVDVDLVLPRAAFVSSIDLALKLRARGRDEAEFGVGNLLLRADHVALGASWSPPTGVAFFFQAPNLVLDVDGVDVPVPVPQLGAGGRVLFSAADWAALEQLLAALATAAAPPWLDDLIGLLGWQRQLAVPAGSVAARLSLAAFVLDPAAALQQWLADTLRGDHELLQRAFNGLASLLTGARGGTHGVLLGSGSPADPWRLPLGRTVASAEVLAWVGPDGPLPLAGSVNDELRSWRPGMDALASSDLLLGLAQAARLAPDIAALIDGRDDIAAGLDALVVRWTGSDGLVLPPASAPAGVVLHRVLNTAQGGLLGTIDLEALLGSAPATVVHVAVAAREALPWADMPLDRVIDLRAPALQAAAFALPAAATGDWFVALGGRDACRNPSGDADGTQGQADRLARVLGAFTPLGGGLALVADAAAGHAARRAAEAVSAVTALVTAGTPLGPVSLQVLDAPPAADALRLLQQLLPPTPAADSDDPGDDPDLHLARGLVSGLTSLMQSDDPGRELRPPSVPPGAPRAGLDVHMLFGEIADTARLQRAVTSVVAAGLADRAAVRALATFTRPDRLVLAVRASLSTPAPAAGQVRLDGHAQLVLGELRAQAGAVSLHTDRVLNVHLGVGRHSAWLVGGPDPGRAPGDAVPHQLRRASLDLALPLGGGAATAEAQAWITLHEARVFELARERWRVQASGLASEVAGFDAATTLLPEARVLLSSLALALGGETSGPGAALTLLLRSLDIMDTASGSVPDAIEHLLNDPAQQLRALIADATRRDKLVAALRALWPGLPAGSPALPAVPGEVVVGAGPLVARVSFAPWRVEVQAGAAANAAATGAVAGVGAQAFGWFDWQARLVVSAAGIGDGSVRIGVGAGAAVGSSAITGGLQLELNRALRLALTWDRPGAVVGDALELWPHPQAQDFERALVRLVPAELTRVAFEGLRQLDETARPVIDAVLSAFGLLGAADAQGRRRVPLPAALFADPVAWLRSEAALGLGLGAGFAPTKLLQLFDGLKPLLGIGGAAGSLNLAPGITLRAEADTAGHARLALALDSSAFELPVAAAARLAFGGAFHLTLAPGSAARAGAEVFVGLRADTPGRSAVHLVLGEPTRLFLRPAVGADLALFPNPAGLGQLAQGLAEEAVTQALPLVLNALAAMQPEPGLKGQVGTLVARIGDAMALRTGGQFVPAALRDWAVDPALALANRLPALLATALDGLAQALSPLLPGGASASFAAGVLRVQAGGFELALQPSPLSIGITGVLNGLPAIEHARLALTLDASGLKAFDLQVGPANINAGGVILRPAFSVVAGNAPVGGARAQLALGLPGDRLVGARWIIGGAFDLVLVTAGHEDTNLETVALGLLEAVLDLVASFVLRTDAVTQLLAKRVGSKSIREVMAGALLEDAAGAPALVGQLFNLQLLLARLQRLAANVASANPSITIDGALTIGLSGSNPGDGSQLVGVRLSLPRPAKLLPDSAAVTLTLENDARWISSAAGAVPEGIVIDLLKVGPAVGAFAFTPGVSVNGVGLRVGRRERPLLEAGSFSIGSVALHVFARVNASTRAGGVQLQLSELAAGVASASGGNAVGQGILGDAGSGSNRLAPAFSPALSVQKHGSGPVLVGLRAGDGTGPWWLAIQRGFGPLYVEQVGFGVSLQGDQLRSISLLLDGRVSLLGLTAAVDDLQLTFVVASNASFFDPSRWAVDLAGLAFDANMGGLTLQGGLRKFGSGDTTQYVGMLMGRFAVYGLSVFGGYGQGVQNGQRFASFFAFGAVNGPIGGVPAFFVTGIGGGLGINRQLLIPTDLSRFDQYPFIKALDPAARPSGDPMGELIALGEYFPMERGSFWFAAGLSFTSFALVDGVVVVSVQVGDGLQIALLGLARMALPRPQVAIVSIELGLVARFSTKEGVLWVQAQLTDNSWVLYPEARLTGGFAFVSWFGGPNRGQFVLTIGGYHPKFHRAGYPEVPRLGLNWRVGPFLTIKGESYFALTSEAVMAGVRVEVSATFGPAWAQVIFGADGIVFFDPFHFEVHAYASIRAGVTIDVWIGEITFSISITADIFIEGPSFHGIATFSVGPVDLAVEFGDAGQAPRPLLLWGPFIQKYLEDAGGETARVLAAATGKGALPPGTGPGGATDTGTADGSAEKPFEVYAEFEITLTNSVPTRRVVLGARTIEKTPSHSISLAPMGLADVSTVLTVTLTRDGLHTVHTDAFSAEVRSAPSFPLGVWGPPQRADNPKIPSGDVLEAIDGLRLYTVADIPAGLPPIDYKRRVEAGVRHPLPFVSERATRPQFSAASAALRAQVPATADDNAVLAVAAQWAARADGRSRTSVASLRGERAAPPRLGSLTDGLAIVTPPTAVVELVDPGRRAAVNTFVQRPKVVAVLGTGLDEPERAGQRTTVGKPPADAVLMVAPPTLAQVADDLNPAIPAVLKLVNATRGSTLGKTLVAADSAALTRMARAPLAAVRGRGATREVRERLSALNGALLQKPGQRAALPAGATVAAGEVVVMALPNAVRDLNDQAPRPQIALSGASARVVFLRHGGEVMGDTELPDAGGTLPVPQGAETIAVAVGLPAATQRPGFSGWHAGSVLPSLGHGCALAAQAVVQVEGRVRAVHQHGLPRESGWLRAADLVEGTALVNTRFASPVTLVIVALDDPSGNTARRGLTLALDGAQRALGLDGEPIAPTLVVRGQRVMMIYAVVPSGNGGVSVSVASEDGWHLVGVMAALPGADAQAVAEQLAQRGLDLLVRGAVAAGTALAHLAWLPAQSRGRELPEPTDTGTPRRVRPAVPVKRSNRGVK